MPHIKVYIHFVWTTKNRTPFLNTKEIRDTVWHHIKQNAKEKNIFIDCIGGFSEHCHCLISLGSDQTIEKVMQLIKGESSYWINKQKIIPQKFEWQTEYFAVSVSESGIIDLRDYILNQEEHHKKKTFQEEYDDLMLNLGFKNYCG